MSRTHTVASTLRRTRRPSEADDDRRRVMATIVSLPPALIRDRPSNSRHRLIDRCCETGAPCSLLTA